MPRKSRVVVPGMPHHITDRGSRGAEVFKDDADRLLYLEILQESCQRYHLRICAYCLMTNHVHLIAIPENPDSIRQTFHRTDGCYSRRFNLKYEFQGHLWQERPFSCVLSERHLWNALRYVERNPVRAGIVGTASDYRWSSAPAHCGKVSDQILDLTWTALPSPGIWTDWLGDRDDPDFKTFLRGCTFAGMPCGDEDFVRSIEQSTGRDLSKKKPGPKPKRMVESLVLPWTENETTD